MAKQSILSIVVSRVLGFIIFLLLMGTLNMLRVTIASPTYHNIVIFLNHNFVLIIVMSLLFFIAELFGAVVFPFNLPSPLFSAFGSLFLIKFILNVFGLIELLLEQSLFDFLAIVTPFIYPIVFMLVIIFGYIAIFVALAEEAAPAKKRKGKAPTWKDIGDELRGMIHDIIVKIRRKKKN